MTVALLAPLVESTMMYAHYHTQSLMNSESRVVMNQRGIALFPR